MGSGGRGEKLAPEASLTGKQLATEAGEGLRRERVEPGRGAARARRRRSGATEAAAPGGGSVGKRHRGACAVPAAPPLSRPSPPPPLRKMAGPGAMAVEASSWPAVPLFCACLSLFKIKILQLCLGIRQACEPRSVSFPRKPSLPSGAGSWACPGLRRKVFLDVS